jgi:hypothetical protein
MVLAVQNSTVCGIVNEAQQGAAAIINPNWTTTASQRSSRGKRNEKRHGETA